MASGDCRALSQNARQSRRHQLNHQACSAALRRRGRRGRDVGHRAKSSDAKPNHPVMTFERMWDGPKPPRANLNRQAKTVVHMWDARELLKPYLSKLLMLRICGVAQSCSSCEASGSVIRSKPDAPSSDYRAHVGWTPKMLRSSLKRPANAVADM